MVLDVWTSPIVGKITFEVCLREGGVLSCVLQFFSEFLRVLYLTGSFVDLRVSATRGGAQYSEPTIGPKYHVSAFDYAPYLVVSTTVFPRVSTVSAAVNTDVGYLACSQTRHALFTVNTCNNHISIGQRGRGKECIKRK